ncbi:MAG: hypothetical protein AAF806_22255 [Bacteroidota bacterium]
MKRLIILFVIVFITNGASVHQDLYVNDQFGNIHTRIKTGFEYEQINIVTIIGRTVEKLAEKLNYDEPILLDFNHTYTSDIQNDYFISYDKGKIENLEYEEDRKKDLLKEDGIVIRQVSHEFDVENALRLVEYSISNLESIRKNQKKIIYAQNYCNWKINSIDTLKILQMLSKPKGHILNEVIMNRTYLNFNSQSETMKYFYQNGMFHFSIKSNNKTGSDIILSTKSLFQIEDFSSDRKIIFDSDSTFYYLDPTNKDQVRSKHHTITEVEDHYKPFDIMMNRDSEISIKFSRFATKEERLNKLFYFEKKVVYDIKNDTLIN